MPIYVADSPSWSEYLKEAGSQLYSLFEDTVSEDTDITERQYAKACTEQLENEIRDVWNQGMDGTKYVDKYHGKDMRIKGMFDIVGSDAVLDRDGYKGFAVAAQALTDSLELYLTGEPEWKGTTTDIPTQVGEEKEYYGRTSGSWIMEASTPWLPIRATFEGQGEHWWNPMEEDGSAPQSAYAEVDWGLESVTLKPVDALRCE